MMSLHKNSETGS